MAKAFESWRWQGRFYLAVPIHGGNGVKIIDDRGNYYSAFTSATAFKAMQRSTVDSPAMRGVAVTEAVRRVRIQLVPADKGDT